MHQLPYYYNTLTGVTDWIKPESGTIIPLQALQNTHMGQRVSVVINNRASRILSANEFQQLKQANEDKSYHVDTPRSSICGDSNASKLEQAMANQSVQMVVHEAVSLLFVFDLQPDVSYDDVHTPHRLARSHSDVEQQLMQQPSFSTPLHKNASALDMSNEGEGILLPV